MLGHFEELTIQYTFYTKNGNAKAITVVTDNVYQVKMKQHDFHVRS